MMRRTVSAVLLVLLVVGCATYDMEIPGVAREPYEPQEIPSHLDRVISQPPAGGGLVAGVREVDITPYDRKAWIAGFGPGRKSRGVISPVTARVVYLHDGREPVVMVALDAVGLMWPDVKRLRELISTKAPDRVLVFSTHNHEGPDTMGYWGPGLLIPVDRGVDEDWLAKTFQRIALAVNEAIDSAEPVRIAFGYREVEPGWSTNLWFPENEGPNDRWMGVIRLEKQNGDALATIINWACHAETLFDQPRISADFPGYFYDACRAQGGGMGVFLQGASGGMITGIPNRYEQRPKYRKTALRIAWAKRLGETLARTANETVANEPRLNQAPIKLRSAAISVPMHNFLFRVAADNGILRVQDRGIEKDRFRSLVATLDLGPATFAMVPGEPFPSVGGLLKQAMPWAKPPFVVGLANDELAYMMTPEEWQDSHYGYERSMSCGPQTGQLVVDALRALLREGR